MGLEFGTIQSRGTYSRRDIVFEGEVVGTITRDTGLVGEGSDAVRVTTHYDVNFNNGISGCVTFPVMENAEHFSDYAESITHDDLRAMTQEEINRFWDRVYEEYLGFYPRFNQKDLRETSRTARGAGAKAKAHVKKVYESWINQRNSRFTQRVKNHIVIKEEPKPKKAPTVLVGNEEMSLVELAAAIEQRIKELHSALALADRNQSVADACEYLRPRLEKSLKELTALKKAVAFCLQGGNDAFLKLCGQSRNE
tara:strand:- start:4206 stop:4964 length:759 start_codon:yes stop_codon:yes gene_type:complete